MQIWKSKQDKNMTKYKDLLYWCPGKQSPKKKVAVVQHIASFSVIES